ncbi:hypothetical protein DL96DRAFT_1609254 [Flagelloscypha sp. PMI_526]|nr:hypothetical protein DL96DRAFT_1609254 [Flagelloscypha sp. PMI_526]
MSNPAIISRNTEYYMDNLKVLKVENELFRMPIAPLVKASDYFKTLFQDASPATDDFGREEGSCDEFPIVIPDETAASFVRVLQWIYSKRTALKSFNDEAWIDCIRLSQKFLIPSLLNTATEKFSKADLEPMRMIEVCKQHHLKLTVARKAYSELCRRWEYLPATLKSNEYIALLQAREEIYRRKTTAASTPYCLECRKWVSCTEFSHRMALRIDSGTHEDVVDRVLENLTGVIN